MSIQEAAAPDPIFIADFHKAVRFKMQGRLEESKELLAKCLTRKENDAAIYYALGEINYSQKNYVEAEKNFLKAQELNPTNIWYTHKLAVTNYEQSNYAESSKYFKTLVDREPRNIDWMFQLSECYIQGNQIKEAIIVYNQLESVMGAFPGLYVQKYQLYSELKETSNAINELNKGIEKFPNDVDIMNAYINHYYSTNQIEKALEMLKEKLVSTPKDGTVHIALAEIYLRKGNSDKAFHHFKLGFEDESTDAEIKIQAVFLLKERYANRAEEISALIRVLHGKHNEVAAINAIHGDDLLEKGDLLGALNSYKKACEIDPSKFVVWNQIVIIEYQENLFDELYKDAKACLELFPTSTMMYLMYGVAANELKKYEEASDALSIGREYILDQNDLKYEFNIQQGIALYGLKDYLNGDQYFQRAINENRNSNLAFYEFANAQVRSKRMNSSTEGMIKKIRESSPNKTSYALLEVRWQFNVENYARAKELLDEISINEKSVEAALFYDLKGDVLYKLNKKTEAVESWRKALSLGCDNSMLTKKIEDEKWYEEKL